MRTKPSPKTIVCRDCGYEQTIRMFSKNEDPHHFCERCGSQSIEITETSAFMRHHPVQYIKELLHTKIF